MALFKRNKKNTIVLPELEKYYEAERRERSGLAWILALVSVAGIALVLIGAFFGGRWIYRHNKKDKPATVAVVQKDTSKSEENKESNNKAKDETKSDTSATPKPTPVAPTTLPATNPASTPAPSTSSPAASSSSQLANTGPESVIPAFMTTTALSMFFYRRKLRANH